MSQRITLTSNDDHSLGAWRSDPKAAAKGGIVMLHAVYGLTDHMGDVCDAFGAQGYAAIAPALYDRIGPGIVHPYTADGVAAGRGSYGALSAEQILADVAAGDPRSVAELIPRKLQFTQDHALVDQFAKRLGCRYVPAVI